MVYAAAWGLLVALNNGAAKCCNLTSVATGAQMIETLLGVMYWARMGVGALQEFRAECVRREMGQMEVWDSTYWLLRREAKAAATLLDWHGGLEEYLRWWGDLFSEVGVGGLLVRWQLRKNFVVEPVLHVVECVRRGWWGLEDSLRDKMYLCETWPPRIEDGEVVGGLEALEGYAQLTGVPIDVWLGLPCLEDVGVGEENPFHGYT